VRVGLPWIGLFLRLDEAPTSTVMLSLDGPSHQLHAGPPVSAPPQFF
jgi:hypothetical protein